MERYQRGDHRVVTDQELDLFMAARKGRRKVRLGSVLAHFDLPLPINGPHRRAIVAFIQTSPFTQAVQIEKTPRGVFIPRDPKAIESVVKAGVAAFGILFDDFPISLRQGFSRIVTPSPTPLDRHI